ncbi:MAG: hypothetical protein AABX59_03705 [Nanoarchaeota archaeon]
MIIKGLDFIETCSSCPEQYEVFKDKKEVGYVRLRWGSLRVDYPKCGAETIFDHDFKDNLLGCFPNDESREVFLNEIANRINERLILKLTLK